jgi:citrate lyase subunit beta/citryl-CoA lyase
MLDFVGSLGAAIPESVMRSPGQFQHPLLREVKIRLSLACHAYDVVPSHNLTLDFGQGATVFQDAKTAREEFGYLRMWSIHPNQIEPILRAFRDDDQTLSEAVEILLLAKENGWGPIRIQDSMHDLATYRMLWAKIRIALLQGNKLPKQANQLLDAS